jgi:hypothetical protein
MLFGKGGWDKEVFPDIRVGLPPLNMALAQQMVEGTHLFPPEGLPKSIGRSIKSIISLVTPVFLPPYGFSSHSSRRN